MPDMTLAEALALADQDSPLPHLAGQALKVLRDQITTVLFDSLLEHAEAGGGCAKRGPFVASSDRVNGRRFASLAVMDANGGMTFIAIREFAPLTPEDC